MDWKRLFVFACVLLSPLASAHVYYRPTNVLQLGASYVQNVHVVPCKIKWIDRARLRRDFAFLRALTDFEIDEAVKRSFCVVTRLQRSLEGILISEMPDGIRDAMVFHPLGYRRASMATFLMEETELLGSGIVDLKGSGLSPEHEGIMRRFLAFYTALQGDFEGVRIFGADGLADWKKDYAEAQKKYQQAAARLQSNETSPEEKRRYRLMQSTASADMRIYGLFLPEFERILSGQISTSPEAAAALLEELRSRDYLNGSATTPRVIKEVAMQRATQLLFDEERESSGLQLETVESYFALELPWFVLGPNGKRTPAAILGRQAHWRALRQMHGATLLNGRVFNTVNSPLQADIFGAVVDFETNASRDPRISKWADWDDYSGQPIDKMAERAVADSETESGAIQRLLDETSAPLSALERKATLVQTAARSEGENLYQLLAENKKPDAVMLGRLKEVIANRWERESLTANLPLLALQRPHLAKTAVEMVAKSRELSRDRKVRLLSDLFFAMRMGKPAERPQEFSAHASEAMKSLLDCSQNLFTEVLSHLLKQITVSRAAGMNLDITGFIGDNPDAQIILQLELALAMSNFSWTKTARHRILLNTGLHLPGETTDFAVQIGSLLRQFHPVIQTLVENTVHTVTGSPIPEAVRLRMQSRIIFPDGCRDIVADQSLRFEGAQ